MKLVTALGHSSEHSIPIYWLMLKCMTDVSLSREKGNEGHKVINPTSHMKSLAGIVSAPLSLMSLPPVPSWQKWSTVIGEVCAPIFLSLSVPKYNFHFIVPNRSSPQRQIVTDNTSYFQSASCKSGKFSRKLTLELSCFQHTGDASAQRHSVTITGALLTSTVTTAGLTIQPLDRKVMWEKGKLCSVFLLNMNNGKYEKCLQFCCTYQCVSCLPWEQPLLARIYLNVAIIQLAYLPYAHNYT